jgi:RNA polymerase sigma-70 factor, ECF subfamily
MADDQSAPDETRLLAAAAAGDARCFGLWIEQHYDFIYRIAYRLMGHQMDAEDLTQDVCLSLPEKLKKFSGKGHVRGWLAQVTMNAGRDLLRAKGRRPTSELDENVSVAGNSDPAAQLYLQQVLGVMRTLPDKSYTALLLAAEGLSTEEMAVALDCATGTVGWRISTARAELAKRLMEGNHAAASA